MWSEGGFNHSPKRLTRNVAELTKLRWRWLPIHATDKECGRAARIPIENNTPQPIAHAHARTQTG
eukprot:7920852-Alexandrium_andersonii.AAC.1